MGWQEENEEMRTKIVAAVIALAFLFPMGCKTMPNFGPEQCQALAHLATSISVRVTEVADEEKAALVAEYGAIVNDLADFGCSFVPRELDEE